MKKDALILALITLIAGLLLGGVFELTKGARAKQEERTKNNAYRAVFKDSEDFKFKEIELSQIKDIDSLLAANGLKGKLVVDGFVLATDKNDVYTGYIVNITSKEGYGGDISFSVGISLEGAVTGISILSISETPGLGMKAKEDSFLNQYIDKNGKFVVNKTADAEGNGVDAISGATITSNAMTNGVNGALVVFEAYTAGVKGGEASDE